MTPTYREQTAWLAGVFEGEGTFVHFPNSPRWSALVGMTDESVVHRFAEYAVVGRVYGPYGYKDDDKRKRAQHKPYWRWQVTDADGFLAFAARIGPWLSERRREKLDLAVADMQTVTARPHAVKKRDGSNDGVWRDLC